VSTVAFANAVAAAAFYVERGYAIIPIPTGRKGPRESGWQLKTYSEADIVADGNIGLKTGRVSGDLADVDLDAKEAVLIGSLLLPKTAMRHGRPSKRSSHHWFVAPGVRTKKYRDPEINDKKKATLLELRSDSSTVGHGLQTLVPPSINAESANPPERLDWEELGEPFEISPDDLTRSTDRVAAASLILRYWSEGSRHDSTLPIAGAMFHSSYAEEEVQRILEAIANAGGADIAKVRNDVHSTAERFRSGLPITGIPSLKEFFPSRVVDRICEWLRLTPKGGPSTPSVEVDSEHALTDLWTARLLVQRHGKDIRYAHDRGKWFIWDGRRFALDETGKIDRLAKDTIEAVYQLGIAASGSRRKELLAHAAKSETASRIRSVLELARTEPGVAINSTDFDRDLWLFNVENGTLDLHSGRLRAHRREDLISNLAPVVCDTAATSPRFDAFLRRIFANDTPVIAFLQRAIGYSLTGLTTEQVFFVLWGGGANGKTTLVKALARLFGDYGKHASVAAFMARQEERVRNDLARLAGARFVSAVESRSGGILDETVIKEITGTDQFTARFLFHEEFTFDPQMKIWLASNFRPKIRGRDEAIWRRVLLVPFNVTIPRNERDGHLADRLIEEMPGILNWAVDGCLRWQAEGLWPPDSVVAAVKEYRLTEDQIGRFLDDEADISDIYCVPFGKLRDAYADWCAREDEAPYTEQAFGRELAARSFESDKGTGGKRLRFGLRLKERDGVADSGATSDKSLARG
jgi:P4 family phage/plasmid primase-like protien